MKKLINVLLLGLSFISVNAFAALADGSLIVGGQYAATGGTDLSDATDISLETVFANGSAGDISVDIFTPAGTGGSASLTAFSPVNSFFTVGGWTLDITSLTIVDQTAGVLNLTGTGVLLNDGFDPTDAIWSFSSQSQTSYSMSVETSVVPVPAAVWLFGSGLIGLVGIARRKA